MKEKAVVLLSGGLDSTVCIAIAKNSFNVYAVTFDYNQKHIIEIEAAKKIAKFFNIPHYIIPIPLEVVNQSALTSDIEVPKNQTMKEMTEKIPVTYVPARNIIFLSLALSLAEKISANHIYIGVNVLDHTGYPDCRPEFIEAFEKMANLGTERRTGKIIIHTPLIHEEKYRIIRTGFDLGVDFSLTHSCYDPKDGRPCGECNSCILRREGFKSVGIEDPLTKEL